MQQTHISQPSGSGADEGTGSKPGVPDVPTNERDDEEGDDDDVDQKVVRDDDKDDDEEEGVDDKHESNDDETDEETRDEESFDPISQTPKNSEDEGDGEEDQNLNIGNGGDDDEDDDGEEGNDDDDDQEDDDEDDEEKGNDDAQASVEEEFIHPSLSKHAEEETRDEESFDPISKTLENSNDEGNGEENLDTNVGRDEGHDEEEEEDELYRDVNINLGRGIETTKEFEDSHVTLTPEERHVKEEEEDELYRDVNINQGRGPQASLEVEDSHVTLTPVNPDGQQESSSVSSQFVTSMLNLTLDVGMESIFGKTTQMDVQTPTSVAPLPITTPTMTSSTIATTTTSQAPILPTTFAGAVSSIPRIVNHYMDQRMNEAVKVFVQIQSDRFRDEAQRENDEFLRTVDESMKKIIQEQVKEQVKMELKKILIKKMEGNKSIQRSDEQRNLYKALVEAYESDTLILDTYRETITLKRQRDDDADKDDEPSAGLDWGSKRCREEKGAYADYLSDERALPFKKPPTPNHDWNKTLPAVHGSIQPWISELAKQADSRSSFNELMDTPLDFSNFLMNRLRVDTLTPELLAGPTYELMKGSCQQYSHNLLQPLPLIPNNRGHRVIPSEHFIKNDLEYLRGGASSCKYTTITKTKAADYGHIKWIEVLVPRTMWITEPIGYDKHALGGRRIIAVTELKIVEWHSYKHLDWITVRRDDDNLYKFKEGDFKRLRIQDIEDIIVIQRRMEDLQLGVESYQKKLNLTKLDSYRSDLKRKEAYTAYSNPRGFIYQNKDKRNRLMRINELHKFSDGTLTDVRTALDDRLKGIQMQYLPQSIWRKSDKDRAAAMIQAIDKRLKTKRIMRSLERVSSLYNLATNLLPPQKVFRRLLRHSGQIPTTSTTGHHHRLPPPAGHHTSSHTSSSSSPPYCLVVIPITSSLPPCHHLRTNIITTPPPHYENNSMTIPTIRVRLVVHQPRVRVVLNHHAAFGLNPPQQGVFGLHISAIRCTKGALGYWSQPRSGDNALSIVTDWSSHLAQMVTFSPVLLMSFSFLRSIISLPGLRPRLLILVLPIRTLYGDWNFTIATSMSTIFLLLAFPMVTRRSITPEGWELGPPMVFETGDHWGERIRFRSFLRQLYEEVIVVRNKARLVAQGHTQEEGIDYEEVFASVARIEAIKLFLAYASFMGFMVYQMDVKSAFLYGTIEEDVYVCQPPGFEDPDYPDKVYKVVNALYGLHQALRAWYETLANYLLENDKFQMSSMGELTFFLGLQVKQKPDGIFIRHDKYVAEISRKFGLTDEKLASTPIDTEKPLLKDLDGEDVDVHTYRSMIGSFMFMTSSRPDIMFAVCACARFQVTPKASHLHAVKRIFRYLKGKSQLGLGYPKDLPFNLVAYSDSYNGGASLDKKSTTGGCQFFGCRLISCQCKKQTFVATSSTKAEYVAATSCYAQVLWIRNQLLDYG
nr:putative ribonuclease H-like domain-containing protein [Tanacetum cinerariifolium]